MQLRQLNNKFLRNQMGTCGQKLSKFNKCRPKLLKSAAQPLRMTEKGNFLLLLARLAKRQMNRRRYWQPLRQITIAVFEKNSDDDAESLGVLNSPAKPSEPPQKHG
jgi:hypothetical protein